MRDYLFKREIILLLATRLKRWVSGSRSEGLASSVSTLNGSPYQVLDIIGFGSSARHPAMSGLQGTSLQPQHVLTDHSASSHYIINNVLLLYKPHISKLFISGSSIKASINHKYINLILLAQVGVKQTLMRDTMHICG